LYAPKLAVVALVYALLRILAEYIPDEVLNILDAKKAYKHHAEIDFE